MDEHEQGVALGELVRDRHAPMVADVALVVRDDYQGQGIGRLLGRHPVEAARAGGVQVLRADTRAENSRMNRLMRLTERLGVTFTPAFAHGEMQWTAVLNAAAASVAARG